MENPIRNLIELQGSIIERQASSIMKACIMLEAVAFGAMTLTHGECDHSKGIANIDCFLHTLYATLFEGMGDALPDAFTEMKFNVQQ